MKKSALKILAPLGLILLSPSLSSCGTSPIGIVNIDYGVYRESPITSITALSESSYDDITSRMLKKESFVFAIYTTGCSCWSADFAPVLTTYINETHMNVAYINVSQFTGKDSLGLYLVKGDMPSIVIVSRGKIAIQSVYYRDDKAMFKDATKFKAFMDQHIRLPKMYEISKSTLDNWIANNNTFNLYVSKNSCPDCKRINTNVLYSWSDSVPTVNKPLYIFDIQPYNYASTDPNYWYDEEKGITTYQHLKDIYGLSITYNESLGWKTGYVPTFQNRTGTIVNDMITVYNDSYNSETKTITSYFNEDRVKNMSFLDDDTTIKTKVLDEMEIISYDQLSYETTYINPIANLFLKTYII